MSDNTPYEIQAEIIKRLPVKSLVQFRSVSKQWKSLIDSREFLAAYNIYHNQPQRLIVWYEYPVDTEEKYVSFVDDETFAKQGFAVTLPVLAKVLNDSRVVGSSQGLLCLHGYYRVPRHSRHNSVREIAVLWNPSIRKSVGVAVPGVLRWGLETILGFGVCPIRSDPMIVKITQVNLNWEMRSRVSVPWVVKVFSLSKGSWRILPCNLPNKSIKVTWSQVVIDRFIFWFAFDKMVADDGGFSTKNMIMSFDMTTEEFRVVDLPENLANQSYMNLSISKVWESLAVLEYATNMMNQVCNVWVKDHGVQNLFKQLFTINAPYASIRALGFTKSGEPIMEVKDYYKEVAALVVYEPSLGYINNIGISGNYGSFFVGSYMETLLLLDQADCSVYSNVNN
ncbi:unnamed protein product [Lactuca saligna]|uniref:F-box domain-containing protein n=1 Tax=Lactuca saligna TaxID=75948 RepID=A0AA35VF70_LACSI|nr:unnamed protein product [Lactuca saligna]